MSWPRDDIWRRYQPIMQHNCYCSHCSVGAYWGSRKAPGTSLFPVCVLSPIRQILHPYPLKAAL
jgi:hypothetical protein